MVQGSSDELLLIIFKGSEYDLCFFLDAGFYPMCNRLHMGFHPMCNRLHSKSNRGNADLFTLQILLLASGRVQEKSFICKAFSCVSALPIRRVV